LLQTHPGAQAVKLSPRLVGSNQPTANQTDQDLATPPARLAPGPSTECVSSSRCQTSTPRARPSLGKPDARRVKLINRIGPFAPRSSPRPPQAGAAPSRRPAARWWS